MKTFLLQFRRAWLAANVAGWNGACVAVTAFMSAAGGHALGAAFDFNVAPLTAKQGIAVFVVSFLWRFFGYFEKNPLTLPESPRLTARPARSVSAVNDPDPKP